jgi:hypothetical protein
MYNLSKTFIDLFTKEVEKQYTVYLCGGMSLLLVGSVDSFLGLQTVQYLYRLQFRGI